VTAQQNTACICANRAQLRVKPQLEYLSRQDDKSPLNHVTPQSGIVLWWPRKILKLRGGPSHNVVFDLHQMLGLWSSACVLQFALTGIAIGFEDQVNDWGFAVSHMQPAPWPMPKPPAAGVPPLSPDELLAKAASIAPGARPIVLDFGDSPNDPVLVIMKFPEDHLGRTHVILDRYTGDVLRFSPRISRRMSTKPENVSAGPAYLRSASDASVRCRREQRFRACSGTLWPFRRRSQHPCCKVRQPPRLSQSA
jgi:hypothetical protein